ncbi:hypothetical protein HNR31_002862 [Anoxybacillus caldiproteolyticus]|uniref:Uncharacterized protein n=1 Tax=Thermaerobacillus caldiproteolyticus TaxID=247480 RepID=A0A7V9Z8N2_9BACL|nr:hypothetical protein [Anoxybacillus caldiproteolyticus]
MRIFNLIEYIKHIYNLIDTKEEMKKESRGLQTTATTSVAVICCLFNFEKSICLKRNPFFRKVYI